MPKKNTGLKPGASLPTTAREAKIIVEMSKMAKAQKALGDMKVWIYGIELTPITLKSTDGSPYVSTVARLHFCDSTKKDDDGEVHEEWKTVYID